MARLSPAPDQPSAVAGALGDHGWSQLDVGALGTAVRLAVRGGGPALLIDARQLLDDLDRKWNPARPDSLVAQTLWLNFGSLAHSWWFTLKITFGALALACLGGVSIAAAFALSRRLEAALFPIAVVLQVTPIVAVAPLILIYVESTTAALLLCAWIVAFFPILSNTVAGLRAARNNCQRKSLISAP